MADIVSFGPDKPRRPPSRRLILLGVVALSAAVLAVASVVFSSHRGTPGAVRTPGVVTTPLAGPTTAAPGAAGQPCPPIGWGQTPSVAGSLAGLLLDNADPGSGLERCDRTALDGPWTVVVRRLDGSLGRHGGVVTFPVSAPTASRSVEVGGTTGRAQPGAVTWPVAGGYARIRGDLTETELIGLANCTTVFGGRPAVDPPAGYKVVSTGPYRSPSIHEARYASAAVGEQAALGNGLTYTAVTSGGGFEDQLYAVHTDDGGLVNGRPSVVSSVFGGNATLAWQPAPGLIAYVGYSGGQLDGEAIAALHRLAGRTRPLTRGQWQELHPQPVEQNNEPG